MKRVYLTIEQAVERCYPKATKEEKAMIAEQYRKVLKPDQKIMDWEPENEAEKRQLEAPSIGLMLFPQKNGKSWDAVLRQSSSVTTVV